jgi:hypothetical protein
VTPAYSENIRPAVQKLLESLEGLVAGYAASEKALTIQERIALLYQTRQNREVLMALELMMLAALQLREIEAAHELQKNAGIDMTLAKKYIAQLDGQRLHLQACMQDLPTAESMEGLVKRVLPSISFDTQSKE